jgi:hypothetical protein
MKKMKIHENAITRASLNENAVTIYIQFYYSFQGLLILISKAFIKHKTFIF